MPKFNILNSQRGVSQVLVLVLLVTGIGLGTYLVQQRTNLLPRAAAPGDWNWPFKCDFPDSLGTGPFPSKIKEKYGSACPLDQYISFSHCQLNSSGTNIDEFERCSTVYKDPSLRSDYTFYCKWSNQCSPPYLLKAKCTAEDFKYCSEQYGLNDCAIDSKSGNLAKGGRKCKYAENQSGCREHDKNKCSANQICVIDQDRFGTGCIQQPATQPAARPATPAEVKTDNNFQCAVGRFEAVNKIERHGGAVVCPAPGKPGLCGIRHLIYDAAAQNPNNNPTHTLYYCTWSECQADKDGNFFDCSRPTEDKTAFPGGFRCTQDDQINKGFRQIGDSQQVCPRDGDKNCEGISVAEYVKNSDQAGVSWCKWSECQPDPAKACTPKAPPTPATVTTTNQATGSQVGQQTSQTPPSDTTQAQCTKKTCAYSESSDKCFAGVCKDPGSCGFNRGCEPDPAGVCSNAQIDCKTAGSYGTETRSSEGIKLPIPFGFINLGTPDRLDDLKSQSQTAFQNYKIYSQILAGLKEKGIDTTKAQSLIDQGQAQTNACIK